jgi:molecular chaperone GrpE
MNDEKEDFSIENEDLDDSVVTEEHQGDSIKKLKDKLKDAEAKVKEYLDGWQRERADFSNIRKRDEEAKSEFLKFANSGLIEELLPVLDALTLAVSHGEKSVVPIENLLLQILKKRGLEESNPIGEPFDPNLHEAIGMIPTDKEDDDHRILEVAQKGYILSGKIIRPAKVKIGSFSK